VRILLDARPLGEYTPSRSASRWDYSAPVSAFTLPSPAWLVSLALLAACACNQAQYQGASGFDASCPIQVENPCVPGPSGGPGCAPDPTSQNKLEKQIPGDASYPMPCTVIIPDPTPDESGQCSNAGSCRCAPGNTGAVDGGADAAPHWICGP
jgi:hypothetical protein